MSRCCASSPHPTPSPPSAPSPSPLSSTQLVIHLSRNPPAGSSAAAPRPRCAAPAGSSRHVFLMNLRDAFLTPSPLLRMPLTPAWAQPAAPRPSQRSCRPARGSHALHLMSNKLAGLRGEPCLTCCNAPTAGGGLRGSLPVAASSETHPTAGEKAFLLPENARFCLRPLHPHIQAQPC